MLGKNDCGMTPTQRLQDVVKFINGDRGKNYPSAGDFLPTGIPFIGTQHLSDGRIDKASLRYISRERFDILNGGKVKTFDILYCLRGQSLGRVALVQDIETGAIASSLVILRCLDTTDSRFLYYVFSSPFGQRLAYELNNGSAQPNISATVLGKQLVPYPKKESRIAIANILGSLDDKIELNRRMNETLEATARAIFKSWFVDFDPVRAKMDGRKPAGMDDDIEALFPGSFERTDADLIPKGWSICPLNKIAKLQMKSVSPNVNPMFIWEHYSIPAFDAGGQPVREAGGEIKSNKYVVPAHSILVSKLNPQFPRVWIPDIDDPKAAICSTEFMPFVPNKPHLRSFLYETVCSDSFQSEMQSRATGSTGSRQRIKPKEVADIMIVVAGDPVLAAFSARVNSIHAKQLANIRESRILAAIRDTLLPKLLSGEIHVADAEKTLEEVM